MEKLDNFSKIILATGTINYLANQVYSVNQQMKQVVHASPANKPIFEEGIKHKDEVLENAIVRLKIIMEELGNCLNNCDAVQPIDVRVMTAPFDILCNGKDDVES